jgi:hypothetical protein
VTQPPAKTTRNRKFLFVLKVIVCVLSFGFIYPNIMHD